MPLLNPDILLHQAAGKAIVDTDKTRGGIRSALNDWTDLFSQYTDPGGNTKYVFQDEHTGAAPGWLKEYATMFYVADGRALSQNDSATSGYITLDPATGEYDPTGTKFELAAGTAEPEYWVLNDISQVGGTGTGADKLPKFTISGTSGSYTAIPAGYQKLQVLTNAAPSDGATLTVASTDTSSTYYIPFVTGTGDTTTLYIDPDDDGSGTSDYALSYNASTNLLSTGGTLSTVSISTGGLTVTGTATLNGAVTLGDAAGDDITVSGSIASHLHPKTTNLYDLGADTKAWRSLYLDTSLVFEGSTANAYETTLTVTDPTADNAIVFPDNSGTVLLDSTISSYAVTTETDPVFSAHTVSSITDGTGFLTNDGSGNWSYDSSSYLTALTVDEGTDGTAYKVVMATGTGTTDTVLVDSNDFAFTPGSASNAGVLNVSNLTVAANATISGNLTVVGEVFQTNSTEVNFNDTILRTNVPTAGTGTDVGGPSTGITGLEVFNGVTSGAYVDGARLVYDYDTDKWKSSTQAAATTYDNVATLKFDVSDTNTQVTQANGTTSMGAADEANATSARSLGAVSKCSIEISSFATDGAGSANYAPAEAALGGYPIKHNLDTQSVYVFAIKTHAAGSALADPTPIFCKWVPEDNDTVRVTVGATVEDDKYDIIVVG